MKSHGEHRKDLQEVDYDLGVLKFAAAQQAIATHRIADALERIACVMEEDMSLSKKFVTEIDKTMGDLDTELNPVKDTSDGIDPDVVSKKMRNREPLTDAEAFAMQMHDENRTR